MEDYIALTFVLDEGVVVSNECLFESEEMLFFDEISFSIGNGSRLVGGFIKTNLVSSVNSSLLRS